MAELGIRPGLTNALVVAAALERNIMVGAGPRGRVLLTDGSTTFWYNNGRSNINSPLAFRVAKHKEVTSALLRSQRVAAPRNAVFTQDEASQAWAWAQPLLPVVVKPNNAKHGDLVHLGISDHSSFLDAFAAVCTARHRALVEEHLPGVEHRVLVIDQQIIAATRRVPAQVVGDGTATITELIDARNHARADDPIHRQVRLDAAVRAELADQDLTVDSVPAPGQGIRLRETSNIHTGGDAIDATHELTPAERDFVIGAAAALEGVRLAGFDVLLARDRVGTDPYILEVNASPMLAMHHFPLRGRPRDAAGSLIEAMFGL